jgi:hypothetical protein
MPWAHEYGTVNSTNELLGKIRDFLLGVGWTVADDYTSLAVPFLAMRSTGESGTTPFGILLDRISGVEGLNTCVFRSWQPVAPYWTPNPGTVKYYFSGGTQYFEGQSGAPSFLDRFAVGDTLWGFNPTTGTANGRYLATQGRFTVKTVTATRVTLEWSAGAGYVNAAGWDATADPTYILTKGGPFLFARMPDTDITGSYPTVRGAASSFAYFLFGDKDACILITRIGTSYYGTYLGWVTPYHDPRTTATTAAMTAGVSTSVSVADASLFVVGGRYQVMTDATGHTFKVTAITGNTVSFDAGLEGGTAGMVYPVGSLCGEDPFPVCRAVLRTGANYNTFPGDWTCLFAGAAGLHTNAAQGIQYDRNTNMRAAFGAYFWPDQRRSQSGFLPLYLGKAGDCRGTLRNAYQLYDVPGGSAEDIMRVGGPGGPTYKLFNLSAGAADHWYVVKE